MLDLRLFDKFVANVEGDEEDRLGTMDIISATVLRKQVKIGKLRKQNPPRNKRLPHLQPDKASASDG